MKKILASVAAVAMGVAHVGSASAYFTSTATSNDNLFQAGTAVLQVANDVDPVDAVADGAWGTSVDSTWDSPENWVPFSGAIDAAIDPAQDVSHGLMLRSAGTADFESVLMDIATYDNFDPFTDGSDMGDAVIVIGADYNAVSILSTLVTACDTSNFDEVAGVGTTAGADGLLSLKELNDCAAAPDLLDGAGVILPGSVTDPLVGGLTGTGRQLLMTFRFHPDAGNDYQGDNVEVDFSFLGATSEI